MKVNSVDKALQGINALSNEARQARIKQVFGSPLDSKHLIDRTLARQTPEADSFVKEQSGNIKKLLTKRNALIAAGVAIVGIAAGAIAKHIHNKKA